MPARTARRLRPVITAALLVALHAAPSLAQSGQNVLVVVNTASPQSIQLGEYYAAKRAVPADHLVRVQTPLADSIARADYERAIEAPIAAALFRSRLQDRILYIVLTKGVPLRIEGTGGLDGTVSSVDSELTLLYLKMTGLQAPAAGRVPNPYFLGDRPITDAKPFTRLASEIYLVTRLDGFTFDDAMKLVDRGSTPVRDGRILLDEKATLVDRGGDQWMEDTAARLGATDPPRVTLEDTRAVATSAGPLLGYYSWGSNDPSNQLRRSGLTFANGAIGGMFVSTDGRTFDEPPADWTPSGPSGGPVFAGSFQSLAGDLIRDGLTGVSAYVAEPLLDATVRPQILFPAYLSGMNLAEAYYLAMPYLGWQNIVVGDPLCAPFRAGALAGAEIDRDIDPDTEMPAIYAARRLAILSKTGMNVEALKLGLKVDSRMQRGVDTGIEALLARAVDLEPRLSTMQLRLASFAEARGDFDAAIARYRTVIGLEPQNVVALNNLAFALAVRKEMPAEAKPFAERAYRASPAPMVADTLAWILHLTGDDAAALPLIEKAAAGLPSNAEVRLHAAIVFAARGDLSAARQHWQAALAADPTLASQPEARALQERLR